MSDPGFEIRRYGEEALEEAALAGPVLAGLVGLWAAFLEEIAGHDGVSSLARDYREHGDGYLRGLLAGGSGLVLLVSTRGAPAGGCGAPGGGRSAAGATPVAGATAPAGGTAVPGGGVPVDAAVPAGMLCASLRLPAGDSIVVFPPHAHISDLYVAPAFRRRGLASMMLDEAAGWARGRGAEYLELNVLAGSPAEHVYLGNGFVHHQRRMVKRIAP